MKNPTSFVVLLMMTAIHVACEGDNDRLDYSGTYCLNIQNIEMTIEHTESGVTFSLQNDLLLNGTGTISGDTLILMANTIEEELFITKLIFSEDMESFSGPYHITDIANHINSAGILLGNKGSCSKYDIEGKGIPKFIEKDFTQLFKIEKISKFRSGFGHSYTDGTEVCRSMKHYYNPFPAYRKNNTVEVYAPFTGTIVSVSSDGHGSSTELTNKEIQIKADDQPAFICDIFHCDLSSSSIKTGKKVQAGELLGYARLYYDDLDEVATSFDVALWANTPTGMRLVPYFDALTDDVFNLYMSRGVQLRQDLTISAEERDADPLICVGESFQNSGMLENWMILN